VDVAGTVSGLPPWGVKAYGTGPQKERSTVHLLHRNHYEASTAIDAKIQQGIAELSPLRLFAKRWFSWRESHARDTCGGTDVAPLLSLEMVYYLQQGAKIGCEELVSLPS